MARVNVEDAYMVGWESRLGISAEGMEVLKMAALSLESVLILSKLGFRDINDLSNITEDMLKEAKMPPLEAKRLLRLIKPALTAVEQEAQRIKVAIDMPQNLQRLASLMLQAPAGSVIDLKGQTFSGELAGSTTLTLEHQITVRNGTLWLPDKASIVVATDGVRFENLSIRGPGLLGSGDQASSMMAGDWVTTGLVHVRGGEMTMERCTISGSPSAPFCAAVKVDSRGSCTFVGTNITPASESAVGVHASGEGTSVLLLDGCSISGKQGTALAVSGGATGKANRCEFSGSKWHCVYAYSGGVVTLEKCDTWGAKQLQCLAATGTNSKAIAVDSKIHSSQQACASSFAGGIVELTGCDVWGSREYYCLTATGQGSKAIAYGSLLHDSKQVCVAAFDSGEVELKGPCKVYGSGDDESLWAQGDGAKVTYSKETTIDKSIGEVNGGVVVRLTV